MRRIQKFVFIAYLFCCIASCKQENKINSYINELNPSDTFLFDFPLERRTTKMDSGYYRELIEYDSLLGIKPLISGTDSLEIRILYSYVFCDTLHLITIKNESNSWQAELCTLIDRMAGEPLKLVSIDKSCKNISPKSGWTSFLQKLFSLKILTLPDVRKIEGWNLGLSTHSSGPVVEVATKNSYRLYSYIELDVAQNNFWQCKNICLILELIKDEFDFKPIDGYCYNSDIFMPYPQKTPDTLKIKEIILQDIEPPKPKKKKKKK